jgi:hypothetical protein
MTKSTFERIEIQTAHPIIHLFTLQHELQNDEIDKMNAP